MIRPSVHVLEDRFVECEVRLGACKGMIPEMHQTTSMMALSTPFSGRVNESKSSTT